MNPLLSRTWSFLAILLLAALVAGCSSTGGRKTAGGGGYYKDDGPGDNPPANIDAIPDAMPRIEPLASGANRPYVVFGRRYVPDTAERPFRQAGLASWYGRKFHGNATSNGETYDMYAMTAAHPTLPIPSYARVTSKVNGRTVIVRVNDRGPFHSNRIMDLSYAAAYKLGLIGPGSGQVVVERILPDEIRTMMANGGNAPAAPQAAGDGQPLITPVAARIDGGPAPVPLGPAMSEPQASAPPRPGAAAAPPANASLASGVYLQVGAFSQQANAQSLASRVTAQLGNGAPATVVEQANQLYRVKIGPYATREAALGAVQQVSERIGILPSLAVH